MGDSAMTEVGGAFEDPEGDTIAYAVSSSDTTVARVTLSGTRGDDRPGRRRPHDHHGDCYRRGVQPEQDSAVRGDGFGPPRRSITTPTTTASSKSAIWRSSMPSVTTRLGTAGAITRPMPMRSPTGALSWPAAAWVGCVGYELNADLDFDTDRDGDVDSDDDYWKDGAGWVPIGDSSVSYSTFAAIFEGNGRTIANLFIDSSENELGLFGATPVLRRHPEPGDGFCPGDGNRQRRRSGRVQQRRRQRILRHGHGIRRRRCRRVGRRQPG